MFTFTLTQAQLDEIEAEKKITADKKKERIAAEKAAKHDAPEV